MGETAKLAGTIGAFTPGPSAATVPVDPSRLTVAHHGVSERRLLRAPMRRARPAPSRRVIIVSNRLPVTARIGEDGVHVAPSAGGLATGLRGVHETSGSWWLGWSGCPEELARPVGAELHDRLTELRTVGVPLSAREVASFYEGYANGVLWPLFHYLIDQVPLEIEGWDDYEQVNERFAAAAAAQYRPGDIVWVHDYQLMLVPELIRRRIPGARIGFFLHIPFPSSELFATLPSRERLLQGVLGADLVGFHTETYRQHFTRALERVLGVQVEGTTVRYRDRAVRTGVFPMGIDAAHYAALADDALVRREVETLRHPNDETLFLGIDRLDYTKGIPRRLLAFERLLERHPELHGHLRLIQVAVPSRMSVPAYETFRQQVDALVGRINGRFGTAGWTPVHYLYRAIDERELVALYAAADVMLVTPVRDGMNLVAKEFVACRTDEDGVLVLSEFAGAAAELGEAVLVNPYDIERSAELYYAALTMPADERRERMRALRARVSACDARRWAREFLEGV